jgi:hypothetical protein
VGPLIAVRGCSALLAPALPPRRFAIVMRVTITTMTRYVGSHVLVFFLPKHGCATKLFTTRIATWLRPQSLTNQLKTAVAYVSVG